MKWSTVQLGEICQPKQWKTLTKKNLLSNGFPVFGANGPIGFTNHFTHQDPTILVGCRGSCGSLHIMPPRSYANGNAMALGELDNNRINLNYLFRFLQARGFDDIITGTSQPQIIRSNITRIEIKLPPLEEQKRIAGILDQAASLCRLRTRALDKLNTLGQAIFHDMFGDVVENRRNWPTTRLERVFELKHGFAFKSETFLPEGRYLLLTPGNFFEEGGFRHRGKKQRYCNDPIPPDYILSEGDILVAMTEQAPGLLGSPIVVPEDNYYLHNQRLGKVEKQQDVKTAFIVELMNNPSIRSRIQRDSTGTKVKHTSPSKVGSIQIGMPPIELQAQFSMVHREVRHRIRVAEAALQKSNALFASLQDRAFCGKLGRE